MNFSDILYSCTSIEKFEESIAKLVEYSCMKCFITSRQTNKIHKKVLNFTSMNNFGNSQNVDLNLFFMLPN